MITDDKLNYLRIQLLRESTSSVELEVVDNLIDCRIAMHEFCDRVENGTAQSHRTYAKFCKILGRKNMQEGELE